MMTAMHVKSATGKLEKVLVSRPDYLELAPIDCISKEWMKKGAVINRDKARDEHNQLINIYKSNGVEVIIQEPETQLASMVFARDFGFTLKEGYVLGRFKELIRQKETELYAAKLQALGVPMIAKCTDGYLEGGDFWQLDDKTLAIGILQRSDLKGVENIRKQLAPYGYTIITVEADERYLHLDMMFNIVGDKTAVAYWEGLPSDFRAYLREEKYDIIQIDEAGIFKHFANLQALGDGKVISLKANKDVNRQLRARGYEVIELDAVEILKAGGGPHCMTFPVRRS